MEGSWGSGGRLKRMGDPFAGGGIFLFFQAIVDGEKKARGKSQPREKANEVPRNKNGAGLRMG